jgi:hypothetical protein
MGVDPALHPDVTTLRFPDFGELHDTPTVGTFEGIVTKAGFDALTPIEMLEGFDFSTSHSLMVPLLGVAGLFLLTRDRQIPSRAPDMAIWREQSSRDRVLQANNTPQGDYPSPEAEINP